MDTANLEVANGVLDSLNLNYVDDATYINSGGKIYISHNRAMNRAQLENKYLRGNSAIDWGVLIRDEITNKLVASDDPNELPPDTTARDETDQILENLQQ